MLYFTNKPVKFLLRSLFLIIFSLALLSCGGSSGGGDANADGDNGNPSGSGPNSSSEVNGVAPVTPLTKSSTTTLDAFGLQIIGEGGSEGDIEVVVGNSPGASVPNLRLATDGNSNDFESAIPRLQLANGVNSINVKNVKRTLAADFSCDDGTTINGVVSADFASGIVNSTGVVNGQALACTSTFLIVLETTVTDTSISGLLEGWGSDDDDSRTIEETGLKSTNCPQDGDGFSGNDPFTKSCSGSFLSNYIVTDTNDVVHKVSTKITFTSTGSGGIPNFPQTPDIPDFPNSPDVPNVPGIPDLPDFPQTPDIPDFPTSPDVPNVPGIPDLPNFPQTPDIPDFPTSPGVPNVPGLPDLFELCLESGGTPEACQILK